MSSEWEAGDRDEEAVYRPMWEQDWDFDGLREDDQGWNLWDDPPANDHIDLSQSEPYSSSTLNDSTSLSQTLNSPRPPVVGSQPRDTSRPAQQRHMGNSLSSTNLGPSRDEDRPSSHYSSVAEEEDFSGTRRQHSNNPHDRSTTQRQSSFGYLPEAFFDTPEENSPDQQSPFAEGVYIDDILNDEEEEEAYMPPSTRRRRQNGNGVVDLTTEASPPAAQDTRQPRGTKRAAASTSQGRTPKRSKRSSAEREAQVEELDLTNEAPSAEEELLQTQREQAIKAQQEDDENKGPLKIGKRQCIICMESFTNATITHCGHIYCHECLTQALIAGEKNSDRGTGNCPVCRKSVSRKKTNQVIPISFMKKSAFKGKARRDMSLLA